MLPLIHFDFHHLLIIDHGTIHLAACRRQRGVARDDAAEQAVTELALHLAQAADTEAVGRDIDEHRADLQPGNHPRLYPGSQGHTQIGMDLLMHWLPQAFLEHF